MKKLNTILGTFLACLLLSSVSSAQVVQIDLYVSAYSPDSTQFAVGGVLDTSYDLIIYDATGRETARLPQTGTVNGLAWSPDGKRLAVRVNGDFGDPIHILDMQKGGETITLESSLESEEQPLLWSADGSLLANAYGVMFEIWDTHTGKVLHSLIIGNSGRESVEDIAWDHVTNTLYILNASNTIFAYDPLTGQQKREPLTFDVPGSVLGQSYYFVAAIALSPDGSRMALAYNDNKQTMQILDTLTGETVLRFNAPEPDINVRVLRWTPDGRRIVSLGDRSGAIRFWDAATGELTRTYTDFGIRYPRTFVFSPDGTQMIVVGAANTTTPEATPEAASARTDEMKTLVPRVGVLITLF